MPKWILALSAAAISLFSAGCSPADLSTLQPEVKAPAEFEPFLPTTNDAGETPSQAEVGELFSDQSEVEEAGGDPETCRSRSGSVILYSFASPRNQSPVEGRIYLPPCYRAGDPFGLPSLYLLHGAAASDQQWDDLGITEAADRLIAGGEIPPLIIIMPREPTFHHPAENPFGEQLIKDLLPWVDSHYATRAKRSHRAIGGLSRGGNWAVRLGLLHWSSFGYIGAHSTPLFRGDLRRLPGWLDGIPDPLAPALYLDIGAGDQHLGEARELEAQLADLGAVYEWHLNPGTHTDEYWKAHLEEYLLWYTQDWGDS